jgi:hypothetical protein
MPYESGAVSQVAYLRHLRTVLSELDVERPLSTNMASQNSNSTLILMFYKLRLALSQHHKYVAQYKFCHLVLVLARRPLVSCHWILLMSHTLLLND